MTDLIRHDSRHVGPYRLWLQGDRSNQLFLELLEERGGLRELLLHGLRARTAFDVALAYAVFERKRFFHLGDVRDACGGPSLV